MNSKINQGVEMVKRLGDNYLYVRELEDEANEEGFRCGLYYGFIGGVISTLLAIIIII